jgi:hypothetical protein
MAAMKMKIDNKSADKQCKQEGRASPIAVLGIHLYASFLAIVTSHMIVCIQSNSLITFNYGTYRAYKGK